MDSGKKIDLVTSNEFYFHICQNFEAHSQLATDNDLKVGPRTQRPGPTLEVWVVEFLLLEHY
jgi:hypothetical protein